MIGRIVFLYKWLTHVQVVYQRCPSGHVAMWWAKNEADAQAWMRVVKHHTVVYGKRGKLIGARWLA